MEDGDSIFHNEENRVSGSFMFQQVEARANPGSPITPFNPEKDDIVPQLSVRERNISPLKRSTKRRKLNLTIEIPKPFLPAFDISHPTLLPPPTPIDAIPNHSINPDTFIEINEAMSIDEFWEELKNKGGDFLDNASTSFDPSIEFNFDGLDDDFDPNTEFRFDGMDDDFDPFTLFNFAEIKLDWEFKMDD
ncbi:uncharacterized protein LOC127084725 [Lathyrus oleraceus]|nr:uncharacterized protein LOC127084725 [Pisum sativum]